MQDTLGSMLVALDALGAILYDSPYISVDVLQRTEQHLAHIRGMLQGMAAQVPSLTSEAWLRNLGAALLYIPDCFFAFPPLPGIKVLTRTRSGVRYPDTRDQQSIQVTPVSRTSTYQKQSASGDYFQLELEFELPEAMRRRRAQTGEARILVAHPRATLSGNRTRACQCTCNTRAAGG